MIITRTRTEKIEVLGVSRDPFAHYNGAYRSARATLKKKLNTCFFCHRKFEEGAGIHVISTSKGNKVGCPKCSEDAYNKLSKDNLWRKADEQDMESKS